MEVLGVTDLSLQHAPDEVTCLPDFGERQRTMHLFALFLRRNDTRSSERGQLDGNIGEGDSQFPLQPGYGVGLLPEQIKNVQPSMIGKRFANPHLHFVNVVLGCCCFGGPGGLGPFTCCLPRQLVYPERELPSSEPAAP